MDVDLRKLRYFAAVAEDLHFSRAAERLFIAQPVLSRQIRALEHELGVELFIRSSRQVSLTDAGTVLRAESAALLAAADTAVRRVRAAGSGVRTLTVGFIAGVTVTTAVRAFAAEHPEVTVELRRVERYDQAEALMDGSVDVAFVRLPITERGLAIVPLYAEPRVAVLPAGHRLADRTGVSITDLADEPVLTHRGATAAWEAFAGVDPRPDGRSPRRGPAIRTIDEKLEHVAAGSGVAFLPESAAAQFRRPDITYVPVTDIPLTWVCVAHREGEARGPVLDFVRAAVGRHTSDASRA
ncbi:LysR family transcriptional regulator [Streptomyces sp. H27-D2]|uniref:LysR family transcriptional regulator n=1 Tax=Streptomyces sp. H27-D2 TaxID=3046304 RepID=UPI002DB76612|nr:LysR substrate-binding domain-containing protein [Streptomyces sp. H27-D2]MEC4018660.1 LysR substrate-binding domain-containing protein [Streptomyces sp. H27-D2]